MISQKLRQILDQAPYRERREIGVLPELEIPFRAGQFVELIEGEKSDAHYGWLIRLFQKMPHTRVAWVTSKSLDLNPLSLAQEGVSLSRFLFLEDVLPEEGFSKLSAFIKSGLFQILTFEQVFFKEKPEVGLRKLQLLGEEYGVGLVMRSRFPTSSVSIHVQVDVRRRSEVFMKVKGGTNG